MGRSHRGRDRSGRLSLGAGDVQEARAVHVGSPHRRGWLQSVIRKAGETVGPCVHHFVAGPCGRRAAALGARPADGRQPAARHAVWRGGRCRLGRRVPAGSGRRHPRLYRLRVAVHPPARPARPHSAGECRRTRGVSLHLRPHHRDRRGHAYRAGTRERSRRNPESHTQQHRRCGDHHRYQGTRHISQSRSRIPHRLDAPRCGGPHARGGVSHRQRGYPPDRRESRHQSASAGCRRRTGEPHPARREERHGAADRRQRRTDQRRSRCGVGVRVDLPRRLGTAGVGKT